MNPGREHFEAYYSSASTSDEEADEFGREATSQSDLGQQKYVFKRLHIFINYFVKEFETKLEVYRMILERKVKKPGKVSDVCSGKLGHEAGGAVGGAIGGTIGSLIGFPYQGLKVGEKLGNALGSKFRSDQHYKKCAVLANLIYSFHKDKAGWREKLVKAGYDLFQSFEMQFMKVMEYDVDELVMRTLAEDATNRIINHVVNKNAAPSAEDVTDRVINNSKAEKENFIAEAAILGESKIGDILGFPLPSSGFSSCLKTPGFDINYKDTNGKNQTWNTSSLFQKVGLIIMDENLVSCYYEKKGDRTEKYGYRRLLMSERWEDLKGEYNKSDTTKSKVFTDYKYTLSLKNIEKHSQIILKNINRDDTDLGEKRMKEAIEEIQNEMLNVIQMLKKYNNRYEGDNRVLINIEDSLKTLNVNEYYEEIKGVMQQALQVTEQGFQSTSQQIEKVADENKIHHAQIREENMQLHKQLKEISSILEKTSVALKLITNENAGAAVSCPRIDHEAIKIVENIRWEIESALGKINLNDADSALKKAANTVGNEVMKQVNILENTEPFKSVADLFGNIFS